MPVTCEKYDLTGPGGPNDHISNKILSSHSVGTKLFLVVANTPTAQIYIFDLKQFGGASPEPAVSADEFYALKEETKEIHKLIARQALGEGQRGPGRPSNAERAAAAAR